MKNNIIIGMISVAYLSAPGFAQTNDFGATADSLEMSSSPQRGGRGGSTGGNTSPSVPDRTQRPDRGGGMPTRGNPPERGNTGGDNGGRSERGGGRNGGNSGGGSTMPQRPDPIPRREPPQRPDPMPRREPPQRPNPNPRPDPGPRPERPNPNPNPRPDPGPRPERPNPNPNPRPDPGPRPERPNPNPNPRPDPGPRPERPNPNPRPDRPNPGPRPERPNPNPNPRPDPGPRPERPNPNPRPDRPNPGPRPERPNPNPNPRPDPGPRPERPNPNPNPRPDPGPRPERPNPNPRPDRPNPGPRPDRPNPNPRPDRPNPPRGDFAREHRNPRGGKIVREGRNDGNGNGRSVVTRVDRNGRVISKVTTRYRNDGSYVRRDDRFEYRRDRDGRSEYRRDGRLVYRDHFDERKYYDRHRHQHDIIRREYYNKRHYHYVTWNAYWGFNLYLYRSMAWDSYYYNWYYGRSCPAGSDIFGRCYTPFSWRWNWYNGPRFVYSRPHYYFFDYVFYRYWYYATEPDYYAAVDSNNVVPVASQPSQSTEIDSNTRSLIDQEVERAVNASKNPEEQPSPDELLQVGRTFVANEDLTIEVANSEQRAENSDAAEMCVLTRGSVVQISVAPTEQNTTATAVVKFGKESSVGDNCNTGTNVFIYADDLIEMNNEFRTKIQDGLDQQDADGKSLKNSSLQ